MEKKVNDIISTLSTAERELALEILNKPALPDLRQVAGDMIAGAGAQAYNLAYSGAVNLIKRDPSGKYVAVVDEGFSKDLKVVVPIEIYKLEDFPYDVAHKRIKPRRYYSDAGCSLVWLNALPKNVVVYPKSVIYYPRVKAYEFAKDVTFTSPDGKVDVFVAKLLYKAVGKYVTVKIDPPSKILSKATHYGLVVKDDAITTTTHLHSCLIDEAGSRIDAFMKTGELVLVPNVLERGNSMFGDVKDAFKAPPATFLFNADLVNLFEQ